jgi:Flp pilus assembly pilin Flp
VKAFFRSLWREESGQDLAEYTLLITLIAIACLGAVAGLGEGVQAGMADAAGGLAFGGGSGS